MGGRVLISARGTGWWARLGSAVRLTVAALLALVLAACAGEPSAPTGGRVEAPAVVTFEVAEQGTFKVELLTQDLVDHVIALRDGAATEGTIPIGTIADGDGGVNAPWSWHLDPATIQFVDVATEVCDGLPSHVEDKTLTSTTYCPWSANVVDLASR